MLSRSAFQGFRHGLFADRTVRISGTRTRTQIGKMRMITRRDVTQWPNGVHKRRQIWLRLQKHQSGHPLKHAFSLQDRIGVRSPCLNQDEIIFFILGIQSPFLTDEPTPRKPTVNSWDTIFGGRLPFRAFLAARRRNRKVSCFFFQRSSLTCRKK